MKEELQNIDDLFKHHFADESAVVPEFIKTNIDAAIEKRHRRFLYFKIFLSIFIIGLISIGAVLIINNNQNSNNNQSFSNNNVTNTEYLSDKKNQADFTSNGQEKNNNEGIQLNINIGDTSDIANSYEKIPSENNDTNQTLKNKETQKSSGTKKTLSNSDQTSTGTKKAADSSAQTSTGTIKVETPNEIGALSDLTSGSISLTPQLILNYLTTPLQNLNLTNLHEQQNTPLVFSRVFNELEPTIPISTDKTNYPRMVSFAPTLNLVNSTYQFNNASDDSTNQNALNDKLTYGVEASLKYRLANSLTFGIGGGYASLQENYHLFKQSTSIDSTLTWTYVYDTLDTLQQFPIDSSYQASYDTTLVTLFDESGKNQTTYLYVPFSIGTQIEYKKFIFELSAIGRLNILLNATGKYFANNQLNDFDKSGTTYKRYSVNWSLSFNTYYKILPRFLVYAGFRYHPKQSVINHAAFSKSQAGYVISAGVALKF